jgi:hypothetical protein
MPTIRWGTTILGVTLATLLVLQLLAVVQNNAQPQSPAFRKHYNAWNNRANDAATNADIFKVGAGKADITGYVGPPTSVGGGH